VDTTSASGSQAKRLQTMFMNSPVGMAFAALDGSVLAANAALAELLGRTVDELSGSMLAEMTHPDSHTEVEANRRALAEGRSDRLRLQRRYLRPDGTLVWGDVSVQLVRRAGGEPDYLQVVIVDITARKLAEEAQERLAAIVQSSFDGVVGAGVDGVVTSWNPGAERIFGYTAEEMIGTDGRQLLPPEERDTGSTLARRLVAGERIEQHHVERVRKDGTLVNLSVTSSPVRDSTGMITGIASVVRDLSEEERSALQAAIVASSSDAIVATTPDGVVTSWNRGAETLYGHSEAEMLGRSIYALVPAELRAEEAQMRAEVAGGAAQSQHRTARIDKQGRTVHVAATASPILGAGGEVIGVSSIARDITGTVAAEQARRAAEARIEAILENAPIGLTAFDANGLLTFHRVGRALRDVAPGLRREVGESMTEMFAEYPHHVERLRRVLAGEEITVESEINGRVLDVRYSPLRDESGRIDGLIGVSMDVTERVEAERERGLLERRLRLSERLQSLGQLAGGVAHDFNNLLAVILNYAQFVADAIEDEAVRRDVEEIHKAAERAARLTKQLLIFGSQDSIEPEVLDLDAVVADMHALLTRTLGEHVRLVLRSSGSTPPIRADRGRIEQVLVNLAVNARDAMPDGGTLTIETARVMVDADTPVHPDLRPGLHARVLVSDTGTGMSDEVIAHAFEPFFTTKPKGLGTGLGLATVYGIVSAAGGHVGIYSEGGLGTTVRVDLPAAEGVAVPAQRLRVASSRGQGETILVLEDDDAVRAVTSRILRRHGYAVVEAATAEEAFELASTHACALLLTDVLMPVMSGREVAERMRIQHPNLPVVFMSGYSQGVLSPQQELEPGVTLIQKPFDEQSLLACVAAAIRADAHG